MLTHTRCCCTLLAALHPHMSCSERPHASRSSPVSMWQSVAWVCNTCTCVLGGQALYPACINTLYHPTASNRKQVFACLLAVCRPLRTQHAPHAKPSTLPPNQGFIKPTCSGATKRSMRRFMTAPSPAASPALRKDVARVPPHTAKAGAAPGFRAALSAETNWACLHQGHAAEGPEVITRSNWRC